MEAGVDPAIINLLAAVTAALATFVTALLTIGLWRAAHVQAVASREMAEAAAMPQVVAAIEANRWSMMHADLVVMNTGNAAAFDIEVSFKPALQKRFSGREAEPMPLPRISLLRPGQSISSSVGEFAPMMDTIFEVTVTWRRLPESGDRDALRYSLDISELKGITQLGASDPLVQIAEQIKKLREDWRWIAGGSRKVKADVYTSADRTSEDEARERWRTHQQNKAREQSGSADDAE